MKNIYIIRHGETILNTQKDNKHRVMTQPHTSELNENGKSQAIKTGKYFKKFREPIDLIIASPTLRTKKTAELIANEIGYKKENIVYDKNLIEIQLNEKYKQLTRQQFADLKHSDKDVANFFKFQEGKLKIKTPIELNEYIIKYESEKTNNVYENIDSINNRINKVIETIKALNYKNILIVSHGGTIRWFNKILTRNVGYDEFTGKLINNKSNCAITYYVNQDDDFYLVSAHSNKHLKYFDTESETKS